MVFFLLSFFSIALAGNCAPGLVNSGGLITIGDNQASTFTLSPGTSICLHTYFTAPAVSTPSTSKYSWSIQPSSPISTNSRLFVGQVPMANQNANCNNFAELGNIVVGSPAPYALGGYGPVTISANHKPSIRIQCTNTVFSCTFPTSWTETCWTQAEPTTTSLTATASPTASPTPVATLHPGFYTITFNPNCTTAICGTCFDERISFFEMYQNGDSIDAQNVPELVIMPNYTARWDGFAYTVSKNDQTFTLIRGPAVCRIVLTCNKGECARWTVSTATSRTISTTRSMVTTRPSSASQLTLIVSVAIGIVWLLL